MKTDDTLKGRRGSVERQFKTALGPLIETLDTQALEVAWVSFCHGYLFGRSYQNQLSSEQLVMPKDAVVDGQTQYINSLTQHE